MSLKISKKISLKKPPGYRDPNLPIQRPPQNAPNLPPTFYTYNKKKKSKNCSKCMCFCCCISLLLLIILFISLGGIFYVWYDPHLPEFNVKSFQLDIFNITPSSDGPTLNTKFKAKIEFKNTNKKMKLVYDKIYMAVNGEGGLNLGEETQKGFVQGHKNVTIVKFVLEGKQLVSEKEGKCLGEKFKDKSLKLSTEISSGIGLVLNGINTGTVGVKLVCGDSTLKQIQNGAKPKCKLFMFRLFYV